MLIARQPIFNIENDVYGYELLHREEGSDTYTCKDDNLATISVISSKFLSVDVIELYEGKKIFINFTEELVNKDIATLFSQDELIIEINELETVTSDILEACKRLKSYNYKLALGEFVLNEGFEALAVLADIIKVDFLMVSEEDKIAYPKSSMCDDIVFLAEKVETQAEYAKAKKLGYTLFQGYYFSKPKLSSTQNLAPSKINMLQLIKVVSSEDVDFEDLVQIIESDVAFSYEILKIVNSAFFSRGHKISSIRQAIVRLGMTEVKKWAMLSSLRKLGGNEQNEIISIIMIRSRFLEVFSKKISKGQQGAKFMTVGILSMIDVLTQVQMERVIDSLCLTDDVKDVLLLNRSETPLALSYQIIMDIEQGKWKEVVELGEKLNISIKDIEDIHFEAITYVIEMNKKMSERL